MKSLFDIFSGKRNRRNKLQEIVYGEAMDRYRNSPLTGHPMLDNFAMALAFTTDSIVANLIYDSDIPEYAVVGQSLDREKIEDISAYAAWRSTYVFLADQTDAAEPELAESENAKAFDRDVTQVAITMYPIRAKVQAVLERVRGIESGEIETPDLATALNEAKLAAVDTCFGVTTPTNLYDLLERSFKITAFIAHRNSVVQIMNKLAKTT